MEKLEETIKERHDRYGDFADNSEVSQFLKVYIRSRDQWMAMEPYKREALEMIMVKISRILVGDHGYIDNWHDIQGFARRVEMKLQKIKNLEK